MKSQLPYQLQKTRKCKIYLSFFAIFLLVLLLVASPVYSIEETSQSWFINTTVPLGMDKSNSLLAEKCRQRADTGPPRSPLDPLIPYIISPRRTFILSHKPKLRWNAVLGVKSYTVSVLKGDKILWENKVNNNEVMYPGKPQLESGVEYLLIVKADDGRSSQEEELPARGFRLLPTAEAEVVKTVTNKLNNQQVTDKVKALETAYIYSGASLKAEAIETLERLIASGSKDVFVYRQLGELYWQVGLTLLAENSYKEAVKLAATARDVAEQAYIATALGNLYIDISEEQEAIHWLNQARDNQKALGNTQRVQELNKQIESLKPVSNNTIF